MVKPVDWQEILEQAANVVIREGKRYLLEQQHLGREFHMSEPQIDDVVRSWGYEEFGPGDIEVTRVDEDHVWLRDQYERVISVPHRYLMRRLQSGSWREL